MINPGAQEDSAAMPTAANTGLPHYAAPDLTTSHEYMTFAIDAAELATWDVNPHNNQLSGNNRLKEWFGLNDDRLIELPVALNAIAEKDRERVVAAIAQALNFSSGGHYDIEYTVVNAKTGQERIVRARGRAMFDEKRMPYRFNGTLQDITAEISGREQRQKLLTLVDNSVDLMAILELNGTNSYINSAGREILGIPADADVTKIPISSFHTPEQLAFVESEILPNVMAKGRWSGQFAARNATTGEIIPLYNNCHRIDDPHTGLPIGVGAVMRDMRPEISARRELAENQARMNLAIETSGLGMWELTLNRNEGTYNARYLEILGIENSSPTHAEVLKRIHPDDMEKRNAAMKAAEKTGNLDYEMRICQSETNIRWIKVKGRTLYEDGTPVKMIGTIMDITDQKEMARQLEEKVVERTRELLAANEELEKKNKELASFAYVSSHDLQEPLRKISTFISRLENEAGEKLDPQKRNEFLSKIKLSSLRMQQLINDLLSFSRTSTGDKKFATADLGELVNEVIGEMQENIQRTGATVTTAPLQQLRVIQFQFHQLITNLLANALKFSKKDQPNKIQISGTVVAGSDLERFKAEHNRKYYCISIQDAGIGFEQKYASRIFDVFQRLHARNEYEGTGIGLAICKKIVDNHQGFIEATGEENVGARFDIYLPM
jgi:PAS domain S-box-containing protein